MEIVYAFKGVCLPQDLYLMAQDKHIPCLTVQHSCASVADFAVFQVFSSWQVLLVDLRCHGESASYASLSLFPNTVDGAAADILNLLRHLRLFPEALVGHSFGGKVVMSMADQFGRIGPRLPRPVQVRQRLVLRALQIHIES